MSLFTYGVITSLQKKINGVGMENIKDGILIISKNKATLDSIMRKKYIADKNIIGYIKPANLQKYFGEVLDEYERDIKRAELIKIILKE